MLAPSSSHARLTHSLVSHHPPHPHCSWTNGGFCWPLSISRCSSSLKRRTAALHHALPGSGKGRISKETHVTLFPPPPFLTPSAWCLQAWVHKHKSTNKCKWLHKVHGLKTGKGNKDSSSSSVGWDTKSRVSSQIGGLAGRLVVGLGLSGWEQGRGQREQAQRQEL